jgi:16S rRNA (cytidine1402-2'-O)-methyltransferase
MAGTLYVIATPLGNLEDLSPRAAELLARVGKIACEDTRRTGRLLARYRISTPMISCHRHNEAARVESLLRSLADGIDIALVSDGGTPAISDPGSFLVERAHEERFRVVPVPGPSAVATLLSAAGLPADRYVFDGYLPHRGGERRRRLRELAAEIRTVVVFETPHRIRDTLEDMKEILGDRLIVLGRELTKVHEEVLRGTAASLLRSLKEGSAKGEVCLAIAGAAPDKGTRTPVPEAGLLKAWNETLERTGGDRRMALKELSKATGMKRSELYRKLMEEGAERT